MKAFSVLHKDPDEAFSNHQKVEKLLKDIQSLDMEVMSQKAVIASQFANDFTGACNYFLVQVSCLHGGAQLESCKYKKQNILAMYGCGGRDGGEVWVGLVAEVVVVLAEEVVILAEEVDNSGTMINGVDVLDPMHAFTTKECKRLTWNGGCQYLSQAHKRMNNRGGCGGRSGCDGRGGNCDSGGSRNVSSVETNNDRGGNKSDQVGQGHGNRECGAHHGHGFVIDYLGTGIVYLLCIWIV
jgi:hypothetical protein